jgi:hypothetical protein
VWFVHFSTDCRTRSYCESGSVSQFVRLVGFRPRCVKPSPNSLPVLRLSLMVPPTLNPYLRHPRRHRRHRQAVAAQLVDDGLRIGGRRRLRTMRRRPDHRRRSRHTLELLPRQQPHSHPRATSQSRPTNPVVRQHRPKRHPQPPPRNPNRRPTTLPPATAREPERNSAGIGPRNLDHDRLLVSTAPPLRSRCLAPTLLVAAGSLVPTVIRDALNVDNDHGLLAEIAVADHQMGSTLSVG